MNVPYNEIDTKDAAKRIGVGYSTLAKWCKEGLINCVDISGGGKRGRYMLADKEVEHLREKYKKCTDKRHFIMTYDKKWDVPENTFDDGFEVEEDFELLEAPALEDDLPIKKPFNLDSITTTISYMQDIKDRLSAIEREKNKLLEKVNDIEAEKNQLINEYSDLQSEVNEALAL